MGRRSKNVEKFLKSLDDYIKNEKNRVPARVYSDELFIFGEFGASVRRRSPDDYVILADRRRGKSFSGRPLADALGFTRSDLKGFYSAFDSGSKFAVISVAGRAAIIYSGLFRSCRVGIMSLTPHSIDAVVPFCGDDYRYIFEDTFFSDKLIKGSGDGEALTFINEFTLFKSAVLSACGIGGIEGAKGFSDMLYSTADLVGCELSLSGDGFIHVGAIERDTAAAMLLCLLSAVRSVSEDRCAYVSAIGREGDVIIEVFFKPYGDFNGEDAAFVGFCRTFSELNGIPFSFARRGDGYCAAFIPERIDPAKGGLKASVIFDFNPQESR